MKKLLTKTGRILTIVGIVMIAPALIISFLGISYVDDKGITGFYVILAFGLVLMGNIIEKIIEKWL